LAGRVAIIPTGSLRKLPTLVPRSTFHPAPAKHGHKNRKAAIKPFFIGFIPAAGKCMLLLSSNQRWH
jgi:hypothetical protein